MEKKKLKLVWDCNVGRCPCGLNSDYDCFDLCNSCKICTQDGMVVTKVKKDDFIYEVGHVSGDEILIWSPAHKWVFSVSPNMDKFSEEFDVVETKYDDRIRKKRS